MGTPGFGHRRDGIRSLPDIRRGRPDRLYLPVVHERACRYIPHIRLAGFPLHLLVGNASGNRTHLTEAVAAPPPVAFTTKAVRQRSGLQPFHGIMERRSAII